MSEASFDRFKPIDEATAAMPAVDRACNTCAHFMCPSEPEPGQGWVGECLAPRPANIDFAWSVRPQINAYEVRRWDSKRQKPCPTWSPTQASADEIGEITRQ
jgi:hypothetical protein